jgi:hypothetical protein
MKIPDNELRIGNLVLDSAGFTTRVESIIPEHNRTRLPIRLTEDWLLNFGFKLVEADEITRHWAIGINRLTYDYLVLIKYSIDEDRFFYRNGTHGVWSVHQLQNLYFALTSEELTIKE